MASADTRDPMYGAAYTGTADKQTVTITGSPTGGTFTLTFSGQTTSGIAFNASTGTVQTALQGLSSIGSGNATVSGSAGAWVVLFAGTKAPGIQPLLTANGASLTGGTSPAVTVTHTVVGSPSRQVDPRGGSQTVLDMYSMSSIRMTTNANDKHRTPNGDLYHE